MGLSKGPTHANSKSHREIRVSCLSNKSVDWAKSSHLGSLSHGMGSLETQFNHDAHRGLMEASIGFPDMPMGSVLSRIQEGLHLLLHDPFSFLLFPCSRPGPSTSPSLVSFVFFFFHFFLNIFILKSWISTYGVCFPSQRACEYVYKYLFSCVRY